VERDQLVRIRLLTTRFHQLHGLRVALGGMMYTVIFGSYLAVAEITETGVLIAIGVSCLLFLPIDYCLKRYYASTFGRQVPDPRDQHRTLLIAVGLGFFTSVFNKLFKLEPLVLSILVVGVFSLWIAIRDWPLRRYYLGATAAAAVAVAASLADGADANVTFAMSFLAIGVAFVPIGFLDHRLLVTLIRESRDAAAAAAEVHSPDA